MIYDTYTIERPGYGLKVLMISVESGYEPEECVVAPDECEIHHDGQVEIEELSGIVTLPDVMEGD